MVTEKNFQAFKKAYEQAVKDGAKVFTFERQDVLTDYAKYLIEYLEKNRT